MPAYERVRALLDRGAAVLLDGSVGSELVRRGLRWRWHGLRTDPQKVQVLHEEYLAAGADLIRTNTFQLNRRVYLNVFRNPEHMRHIGAPGVETRAEELSRKAVEVARAARDASGRDAAIAGVMSPLEHCFRPDLAPKAAQARAEHAEIASLLAEGGVDLLLLESMNTIAEAQAAVEAALDTGLPVWVSFVPGPEGEILSGESLVAGAKAMHERGIDVILVNCAPPEDITLALSKLRAATDRPIGAFAHIGSFDPPSWKFEFHPQFTGTEAWPPDRYADIARSWLEAGTRVIGGCCGTGPDHIRALREAL
ncbi:MAG: homocysteine S-methyltransferase family protein [Gemmatimonadota bacterium]|nr:MAG: homocysteine S-methyltransferase family protein [Gemmatimonadota bacterium]